MSVYPLPIDTSTTKPPLPASIVVPRDGELFVQHYWGNSARPDYNRLWITLPSRHAREVTTGDRAESFPGDTVAVDVLEGEEIRVSLNGQSAGPDSPPNTGPTRDNLSDNARVHPIDGSHGSWGRYIEWEDLNINATGSNAHYNDSRTLIFFARAGWKIGKL